MHDKGPCPYKQDGRHDCYMRRVHPTAICNMVTEDHSICPRYYRMAALQDHLPQLWDETAVCCPSYRYLMLRCAEPHGSYAGCINPRLYPNDGKDVWRNYERLKLIFCPFCGSKVVTQEGEE